MNDVIQTKTIREIALAAPATTRVFEEYKIDYCCGGKRLLEEACQKQGLDPKPIVDKLNAVLADKTSDPSNPPERKGASELIDYILAKHHVFTAQELERLEPLMNKVVARHGEVHPELKVLQMIFIAMCRDLKLHMRKEESILFPFIQDLDAAVRLGEPIPRAHFMTVENPILMMTSEHDMDGARLKRIRELTDDYTPPDGACPSFVALYAGLEDLEKDLHQHIHLENNALFPAAVELEQRM